MLLHDSIALNINQTWANPDLTVLTNAVLSWLSGATKENVALQWLRRRTMASHHLEYNHARLTLQRVEDYLVAQSQDKPN